MEQNNEATGKWLVRQKVKTGPENGGVYRNSVLAELVWSLTGAVHHSLTGSTAMKSMQDYADKLNARGYKPPEKIVKVVADGVRLRNQ